MGLFSKKSGSRTNSIMADNTAKKGSSTSLPSNSMKSPTISQGKMSFSNGSGMSSSPGSSHQRIRMPPIPDPNSEPVAYLKSLNAVRERSVYVMNAAKRNNLTNFVVDMDKFKDVAEYVVSIIKVSPRLHF